MGTVKYTGPVASFHCPTNAEIRSLKVHFSPKQLGEGDPSPENVRPIVGWDGISVHNDDGIIVPEEYQKVEYLSGTNNAKGTNFIDTGIPMTANTIVELTFAWNLGANPTYDRLAGFGSVNWIESGASAPNITLYGHGTVNLFKISHHKLKVTGNAWFVDDKQVSTYTISNFVDSNIILFSNTLGNYADRDGRWSIYECKIYENSNLILHYVPCRRKSDNKPGMYDTVSGEFFTNQGTGEFICGPDVGETISVTFPTLGKNLLNTSANISEGKLMDTVGELTDDINYNTTDYISLPANQTYTFSCKNNSLEEEQTRIRLIVFEPDTKVFKSRLINKKKNPNEDYSFTFSLFTNSLVRLSYHSTDYDIQLEYGDTATTYEPYNPNNTVYGGWIDLITGEIQQEWTEPLTLGEPYYYGGNVCFVYSYPSKYTPYSDNLRANRIYSTFNKSNFDINTKNNFIFGGNSIFAKTDGNGNLNPEWTNWYNSLDVKPTISLELYEPITYHLAPTQLQTFLGQNNVWSNADYVEVEYDLHETQEILNRKAFIMANQPHLVAPEAAQLQSFTTDLAAPLKECKAYFKPKQDFNGYDRPWPAGGGKNLCDCYNSNNWRVAESPTSRVTTSNIGSISLNNNEVILNRTNQAAGLSIILGNLDANVEYTLSGIFNNIDNKAYIALLDNNISENYTCTRKFTLTFNNNAVTFTPIESGTYELLIWKNGTDDISFSNLQLEKGSTATSYKPYENICPIEGWENFEVNKCGKNFSTAATGTEMVQKWPFINSSRKLILSGMPPGQEFTLSASFTKAYEVSTNRRLYLNGTQTSNSTTNNIFCGPSADGPVDRVIHNWVRPNGTIDIAYNNRGLTYSDNDIEYAASLQNVQLELGDTATEYEPYNGTTIPITFPTEAGTIYGGYVDLVNGEMWKTWDYKLLSEFAYTFYSGLASGDGVSRWKFETIPVKPPTSNNELYHGLCAKLKTIAYNNSWNNPYCISPSSQSSGGLITFIILKSMTSTEAADFFSNTYLCYELATPVLLTTLTPTQLKTLRGTNNIWSSANDKIEIKFWRH